MIKYIDLVIFRMDAGAMERSVARFWAELTPREREIAAAIAEGWTNVRIVDRLALSHRAVEKHVAAIYEKLPASASIHRRVQVVLLAQSALGWGGAPATSPRLPAGC